MNNSEKIEFLAELKELKLQKLVSLDHMVRIVMVTEDKSSLDLSKYPPDTIFKVIVSKSD